ncbi:MAG: hypothetical protein KAR42_03125 [candidate division Zixibacteria bacterium]|nr:hypothetical protein [candidate division Zixibacteria bacterium]
MKNVSETYGAARLGKRLLAARVVNDGTRLKVTSLLTSGDNLSSETIENGRLFFNVDERLAIVKKISVMQSSFIEAVRVAQFEISQTLLEPVESFYFDNIPLDNRNGHKRFLTIAYHRPVVDKMIIAFEKQLRKPSGFKLDAVAMTQGYLSFCRVEAGDLQVLANVEPDLITFSFLYRKKLEAVSRMEIEIDDAIGIEQAKNLAADFKMTISFKIAELFTEGITVPLSRVLLCGSLARNKIIQAAIAEQFSIDITLPQFHEGYFDPPEDTLDKYQPEQFIIPLGLAVE